MEQKWTSLVVQWLRTCLPRQGTQIQSLIGELRSHMLQSHGACALQQITLCAMANPGRHK